MLPVAVKRALARHLESVCEQHQDDLKQDVTTTQIYTHVLNRGPSGVRSPADGMPEA
jgi:hypothetical protein